jgi:hypothetical protein
MGQEQRAACVAGGPPLTGQEAGGVANGVMLGLEDIEDAVAYVG